MIKTFFFATLIIAALSLNGQSTNKDEQTFQNILNTMQDGWNEKSGQKYASVFADSHDFIVWNGYYFPNRTRKETEQSHQGLFNGPFKTMDIQLKFDKVRFIRNDIALVHALGSSYTKGQPLPVNPEIILSLVMENKDGSWQVVSFHNLDLEAFKDNETADRSPIPLQVMYANWYKK